MDKLTPREFSAIIASLNVTAEQLSDEGAIENAHLCLTARDKLWEAWRKGVAVR